MKQSRNSCEVISSLSVGSWSVRGVGVSWSTTAIASTYGVLGGIAVATYSVQVTKLIDPTCTVVKNKGLKTHCQNPSWVRSETVPPQHRYEAYPEFESNSSLAVRQYTPNTDFQLCFFTTVVSVAVVQLKPTWNLINEMMKRTDGDLNLGLGIGIARQQHLLEQCSHASLFTAESKLHT